MIDTDKIISHLEEKEREVSLPNLLKFYQELLVIQFRTEQRLTSLPKPVLGSEVATRLEEGIPLLKSGKLIPDWQLLTDNLAEVIRVFARYPDLFKLPQGIEETGNRFPLSREAVKDWLEKGKVPPDTGIEENLLETIVQATLKPFLISYAKAVSSRIEIERWRRPYCPVCGGSPDFSFLSKDNGSRWLVCSRCDTEWVYQRLQCPFCGTQEQNALSYFADEEGMYRLYVCESCKRYIKAIDLRATNSDVFMPLERLYTLDLDSQALEKGYVSGCLRR